MLRALIATSHSRLALGPAPARPRVASPTPGEFLESAHLRQQLSQRSSLATDNREGAPAEDAATEMPKVGFYAVRAGRKPGIYLSWTECQEQINGYSGAKFKKFPTEAAARAFVGTAAGDGAGRTPSIGAGAGRTSNTGAGAGRTSNTSATRAWAGDTASRSSWSSRESRATEVMAAGSTRTSARGPESPPSAAVAAAELPVDLARWAAKGYSFSRSTPPRLIAYADGSGLGNGKHGAVAGAGVFWGGTGEAARHNLAERVPGALQTNNRGELLAIIRAIETCPVPNVPLEIRTDSQYSIKCIQVYVSKWERNGWRTGRGGEGGPVKNADLIRHLLVLLRRRGRAMVHFKYVRGHSGHEGNEAADRLARMGARMPAAPDRTDWLVASHTDGGDIEEPSDDVEDGPEANSLQDDLEVDPAWLMSPEEMRRLESSLADE